jgi:hypothetical protein
MTTPCPICGSFSHDVDDDDDYVVFICTACGSQFQPDDPEDDGHDSCDDEDCAECGCDFSEVNACLGDE